MEYRASWDRLAEVVTDASRAGTVGVAVIGPDGATWDYLGERQFASASTVKIAIMVEVFRQVDAGRLDLQERYTITVDDTTSGSGVLAHMQETLSVSLYDLLYLMMSISDNVATNKLIGLVTIEGVNRTMADLGMRRSVLGRLMRGRLAEPEEQENLATPNDYVRLVEAILDNRAASAAACDAMMALMGKQQNRRRIARYLPVSNKIRWGSKTGENIGVTNDVGFIIAQNGRLIIAVYTENFVDMYVAEQVIGDIARAAMVDTGIVGPLYTS